MGDFLPAIEVVLKHEGGFANEPADKGGPTMMGVTLETMKAALGAEADLDHDGDVDADDVRLLTRDEALSIYRANYWLKPRISLITNQKIATKALDLAVHAGPKVAILLLQRAINHARPLNMPKVEEDGVIGSQTLAAIGSCDSELLLSAFAAEQAGFYLRIIERDPTQARFKSNWLARAKWGTSMTA